MYTPSILQTALDPKTSKLLSIRFFAVNIMSFVYFRNLLHVCSEKFLSLHKIGQIIALFKEAILENMAITAITATDQITLSLILKLKNVRPIINTDIIDKLK